ncbi:MAG TPA: formylglycine-generating enzyme family protein [Bacteroidales bacterium]|nr:formylglycine-generating enzyme family protein [Bacteroidales bacterium]
MPRTKNILFILLTITFFSVVIPANSQSIAEIHFSGPEGLFADSLIMSDSTVMYFKRKIPVLSFQAGEKMYSTADTDAVKEDEGYSMIFGNKLKLSYKNSDQGMPVWRSSFVFENMSTDTIAISNVVPFISDNETVTITAGGPEGLARAMLFRPGYKPVRVILPDNAWELGYTSFEMQGNYSLCSVVRRQGTEGGVKQRYRTLLPPNASVTYNMFAELSVGPWQNGLRKVFRDRYIYDLEAFDNTLYERPDLAWIKSSYLIVLRMAWDKEFFDRTSGKYTFGEMLRGYIDRFGFVDVFGLWPTWPRLGLDQRNQWDLYADLPGGITQLRNFSRVAKQSGTRFFIAYNPWDLSTRDENHYQGMARLIRDTEADGVVLDTRGNSSYELQSAADSVRKGVVMYSEGMAVPVDMPGIISGRVHNAIFLSPELNLNKLIKPDFSIFRVCDPGEDVIHRELAVAFFNGYGTELNMFRPGGRNSGLEEDLGYLARTTDILRQNSDAFLDKDWTPLIGTRADNIYVNRWTSEGKIIYTVLNMRPEGYQGPLFRIENDSNFHYVSLWNHENTNIETDNGISYACVKTSGWLLSEAGTRKEGSVDCIAAFRKILRTRLTGDSLRISTPEGSHIIVWKGNPSGKTAFVELKETGDTVLSVKNLFGYYEDKIIVQLKRENILVDENILMREGGKPWLVSRVQKTPPATGIAPDMVLVPGGDFSYSVSADDDFIPYPDASDVTARIDSFLIDRYPVTNAQYYEFLQSTGYRPVDTVRYLRHWDMGIYRQGQERYPVVNLSIEDMKAYAAWAGKRLPTEAEWQRAAQGTDQRRWPWGDDFHGTLCNNAFDKPTPVDAFNKGMSPYGVVDMVGNVWQMTGDMYFNGSYYFSIIRGGSFYNPVSSWWYIKGGPQPLDKTQMMLMVSPGFDRNSTVGFRCVKDIDLLNFRIRK